MGRDTFVFSTAPRAGLKGDTITDFVADDRIVLVAEAFAGIGPAGSLSSAAFGLGRAADASDERIVHDPASGALFFDADGMGGRAPVQLATLAPHLALTHQDFVIA